MGDNKFNICISFLYKGKPYKLCFHTSALYNKADKEKEDKKDIYAENELLVRGDIQLLMSFITDRLESLFLKDLEVEYDGDIVYKASEYEVWHIPPRIDKRYLKVQTAITNS